MADLSAYVDFTVLLDRSDAQAPRVFPADTSQYPLGVTVTAGILTIIQPDGLTTDNTRSTVLALRLATDGSFQQGNYTFVYTVKAVGYDDTVVIKTATLRYAPATLAITPLIDVFTPVIQLLDSSLYGVQGFNTPTVSRLWNGTIRYAGATVPAISSTDPLLDYAVGSAYYDASYSAHLTTTLTYNSSTAAWLTLRDSLTATYGFEVFTPPSLSVLRAGISRLLQKGSCGCGCNHRQSFDKAQNLYDLFTAAGRGGELFADTYSYIPQLQRLIQCGSYTYPPHTNAPIPPYNWESGSAGTVAVAPIQFVVGSGQPHVPNDGDTVYSNADMKATPPKLVYLQSLGDYLAADQWAPRPSGGFNLLGGRTFNSGDHYTVLMSTTVSGANPFELVLIDPATGRKVKLTANGSDDTNPTIDYTFI